MNNLLDLYGVVVSVFFSAMVGALLLKVFAIKKGNMLLVWSVFTVIIASGVYYGYHKLDVRNKLAIEEKEKKKRLEADSLKLAYAQKQAIEKEVEVKQRIYKYVQSYYNAYCVNDLERLDTFYVYPMERFYSFANAPRDLVHDRSTFEYINHKYPKCKITIDQIQIDRLSTDTLEVSIERSKTKNNRRFTTLTLNKDWKIFSIMNTIRTPYSDSSDIGFKGKH